MVVRFAELAFTPEVRSAQERAGSTAVGNRLIASPHAQDRLGPHETSFIGSRDHFYVATVGSDGWPYVQHRGGPVGFVHVLDERLLAWADVRGNRQYITTGNLDPAGTARVAMIFMDLARPGRLKVLGTARIVDAADDPGLMARLAVGDGRGKVERAVLVTVSAYDWNCPQHITPRFTAEEAAALRAENARLTAPPPR